MATYQSAARCLLLLSLAITLFLSPLSTYGISGYAGVPFAGTVNSQCVYFQSRTCTNVFWPVYAPKLNTTTYDDDIAAKIRSAILNTGSRTCRRWFTDFACRAAFPICNDILPAYPCLRECLAIQKRCPTLSELDCTQFSNQGCRTRDQLGLEISLTPGMKGFNTNQATPIAAAATMATIALSLLLAVFLNANRLW